MEFVDTHCHLNFQSYSDDLVEVIARASQNGVNHIVVPGVDLESSRLAVDLADKFPTVFAAVGVHPGDVDGFQLHEVKAFEDFLSSNKVVAIGEIGLDYYHRQDQKELQQEILKIFLHLAKDSNKPVILHSRES
ncbi:MAG TPA: TatD family hydrolase, partial [Anaerolineaceae bacterium]|nr:TatD family hydrolase [Anaerolineaceae bacterium]